MLNISFAFCAVLTVSLAAVGIGPLIPKPEKFKDLEGCYIPELDDVIPLGKSAPDKSSCMQYTCGERSVDYQSCGVIQGSPPCTIEEDESKPYPECCGTIVCP